MGLTRKPFSTHLIFLPLLLLLTLIVFARVVSSDFTNWDDYDTISRNPLMNPPTWATIWHFWTHADMDIYMPVTQTIWAATASVARLQQPDFLGMSLNPYLFHILNLTAHLLSVALVFSLLRLFTPPPAAIVGAAFFAVHPVVVEPVAWISGFKDVLCGALSLLALRLWLAPLPITARAQRPGGQDQLPHAAALSIHTVPSQPGLTQAFAAMAVYALALLSKPSAVALPLVAVTLAVVGLGWPVAKTIRRLLPWFFLLVPIVMVARRAQPAMNVPTIALMNRPLIAIDALGFYFCKLLWPIHLAVDYGRTPRRVLNLGHAHFFLFGIPMLVCGFFLISTRRRYPLITAGVMVLVLALSPVLGLVAFDFQEQSTVADHYLYLAMLGPAMMIAALFSAIPKRAGVVPAACVILFLSVRSFLQTGYWSDSFSLMSHAAQINPNSWVSHINLCEALLPTSPRLAVKEAQIACRLRPTSAAGFQNLGTACLSAGQPQDGVNAYRRWVALAPRDPTAWTQLANVLRITNNRDASIDAYRQLQKLDPNSAANCSDLAAALAESGRFTEAIALYHRALQINPNMATAIKGLDIATRQQKHRAATSVGPDH